jgi:osmotically-inducible protein OsmY
MKTDAQIRQDVIEELKWDQAINASRIGVEVDHGVVTLAGHVISYAEKWHAEQATQRVAGVKAMTVEIDVILSASSQRNDADIVRSVENVIEWNSSLPRDQVSVTVDNGWVTLNGEVDWDYQKLALANSLSSLMGIKGVCNKITIRPVLAMNDVKSDIEAALRRRASSDAPHVLVHVDKDDVTLYGIVDNWLERDLAKSIAWGTPGVKNVINNITIAW